MVIIHKKYFLNFRKNIINGNSTITSVNGGNCYVKNPKQQAKCHQTIVLEVHLNLHFQRNNKLSF